MAGMAASPVTPSWEECATRYLKTELKRAGVTYEELAERLKKHGVKGETKASIANKLARGSFPAAFLFSCMAALELEGLNLANV
jgi:hypothetical protein